MIIAAEAMLFAYGCSPAPENREAQVAEQGPSATLTLTSVNHDKDAKIVSDTDFVVRYLASSSQWQVMSDGATFADLRISSTGLDECRSTETQLNVRVRFSSYTRTPPWLRQALDDNRVAILESDSKWSDVRLPLWQAADASGQWGSCVMVSGDNVWIEILEWSKDRERRCTLRAIEYVLAELTRIEGLPRNVDSAEYWFQVLPESTVANTSEISIVQQNGGKYTVTGFINAKEPGSIRVVARDQNTHNVIPQGSPGVPIYVGWCAEGGVFFPFRVDVWLPEDVEYDGLLFEVHHIAAARDSIVLTEDFRAMD